MEVTSLGVAFKRLLTTRASLLYHLKNFLVALFRDKRQLVIDVALYYVHARDADTFSVG